MDASYAKMERPRYTSKPPQSKARAAPRRSNRHKRIDLRECARRMAETIGAVHGSQGLKTSVTGDAVVLPAEHATNVCVAMNELITNAVKHGGLCKGDGQIKINIGLDGGRLHTTVWNSGRPIPKDFNSTELQAMGLRLVEGLVSGQYGGSFWLEPHEGGTLASLVLDVGALRETRDS